MTGNLSVSSYNSFLLQYFVLLILSNLAIKECEFLHFLLRVVFLSNMNYFLVLMKF